MQECIRNHRGSKALERRTPEEICVADADAVSHFDAVPSLFYLAFVKRKLDMEEGTEFVKNKLLRSWNKMSEESRNVFSKKFERVMEVFDREGTCGSEE